MEKGFPLSVPVRYILFTDTVSVRCILFTDTVSVNTLFLFGRINYELCIGVFWHERAVTVGLPFTAVSRAATGKVHRQYLELLSHSLHNMIKQTLDTSTVPVQRNCNICLKLHQNLQVCYKQHILQTSAIAKTTLCTLKPFSSLVSLRMSDKPFFFFAMYSAMMPSMGSMTMNFSILASSKDSHQVLATAVKAGATESDRKCQAQYNLASLVPVQLGTVTGLIINVTPTHPTADKYIASVIQGVSDWLAIH